MFFSPDQKKIITLLADGRLHTYSELAKTMNVSRLVICESLKKLAAIGVELTVNKQGYQLTPALQLLAKSSIEKNLSAEAKSLIATLEIHDYLDSTNRYLTDKAQQPFKNAVVCFAEYQSAGKGRKGREWVSTFGSNIYLSILWQFKNGYETINGLSLAVGVAVIDALQTCGIKGLGLKWPNDIYWQNKKLGGILIEVSGGGGNSCHAVIGLGLNFYISADKAQAITQNWVALDTIMPNATAIRNRCASMLLNKLLPTIAHFQQTALASYVQAWQKLDCMYGKNVTVYQGTQLFSGVVQGVDARGLLLLKDNNGAIKKFASGEVSFQSL